MLPESKHQSDAELLLYLDGEATPPAVASIRLHLASCSSCQTRLTRLESLSTQNAQLLSPALHDPLLHQAQAQLRERLYQAGRTPWYTSWTPRHAPLQWGLVAASLLCVFVIGQHAQIQNVATLYLAKQPRPNISLTPGATRPVLVEDICIADDNDLDPEVSPAIQHAVLEEYGVNDSHATGYQIDYLINPQLGGTNDIRNLWPEPYGTTFWNAHAKDELEGRLHQMVCLQQIDLASAQREIASDWIGAYKKYFHTSRPL